MGRGGRKAVGGEKVIIKTQPGPGGTYRRTRLFAAMKKRHGPDQNEG